MSPPQCVLLERDSNVKCYIGQTFLGTNINKEMGKLGCPRGEADSQRDYKASANMLGTRELGQSSKYLPDKHSRHVCICSTL